MAEPAETILTTPQPPPNAARGDNAPAAYLLCRSGTVLLALPTSHVIEILRPLPTRRLEGAPGYVLGASVVRGEIVPVVALDRLAGIGPGEDARRFVMLRTGPRRVALAVGAVLGVRRLGSESLAEMPPLLREAHGEAVASIGLLDRELLLVLEAGRIVPEGLCDAVAGGEGTA